ncbi:hypothetical protein DVH05_020817 [Phytophthora capsici]|nr:hypothetical protein DVH05_020817 [Phytophthora capsici]
MPTKSHRVDSSATAPTPTPRARPEIMSADAQRTADTRRPASAVMSGGSKTKISDLLGQQATKPTPRVVPYGDASKGAEPSVVRPDNEGVKINDPPAKPSAVRPATGSLDDASSREMQGYEETHVKEMPKLNQVKSVADASGTDNKLALATTDPTASGQPGFCILSADEESKTNEPNNSVRSAEVVKGTSAASSASLKLVRLCELKPGISTPWAFIARVFAKNTARSWKTFQDAGTLVELYVTDSPSTCVRATLFNEAADKFSAVTTPGSTCYFSGGRVKLAFASEKNIEVSFGNSSDIHLASSPINTAPSLPYIRLKDLASLSHQDSATTIVAVHSVGGLKRIQSRKGKCLEKRDLLLVDDSGISVVCTTWGHLAQGTNNLVEGSVLIVRNGSVSDYNNLRSLSIAAGSDILQDPACARAEELHNWYVNLPSSYNFHRLTV